MASKLDSIITGSIEDLINSSYNDSEEKYRITLLHKKEDSVYCLLTPGESEIMTDVELPYVATISTSKKLDVRYYHDVKLKSTELEEDNSFFELSYSGANKKDKVALPFKYHSKLPSTIVSRGLKGKLDKVLENYSTNTIETFEKIAESGLIHTYLKAKFNKENKERLKSQKKVKEDALKNIEFLFHEEKSPSFYLSVFDTPKEYRDHERLFVKKSFNGKNLLRLGPVALGLGALVPQKLFSYVNNKLEETASSRDFEEKDETKIISSDLLVNHPKLLKGLQRMMYDFKHVSNATSYTGLLGVTALAYYFGPKFLSYPLIFGSALSTAAIASNLVSSKGKNSSGFISSIINSNIPNDLE